MNREEVFKWLKDNGYVRVEVEYSGGNDEGGVDAVVGFKKNGEKVDIPYDWKGNHNRALPTLANVLAQPVYDEYGGFAWEGSACGKIIWDVPSQTVKLDGSESAEVWNDVSREL